MNNDSVNIGSHNIILFSDILKHNTIAVHFFFKVAIEHLKSLNPNLKIIHSFTDGYAVQYKNKYNFINLLNFKNDIGVEGVWYFFCFCTRKRRRGVAWRYCKKIGKAGLSSV